jgi:hypothetical protein
MPPQLEARMIAAVELIGRTGAGEFQLRYSDDEKPVVWMAVAKYGDHYEAAASVDPMQAVFRLCETLVDGGTCAHCGRPTGIADSLGRMPLDELVCWYQYDPELETFRRGCEGET